MEETNVNWTRFGYDNSADNTSENDTNVDWVQYGPGGYQPTSHRELFAGEESKEPWWKSQFFISQPVLFGMWDGVFTSCLINIFGVIVFLRSGWIVSQAGIIGAVIIVFATVGIALVAVLSAVGICERCRMESGGVYFLLSHVLGPRAAAAIGLLYVFGQAVGCALNLLGFGESVAGLLNMSSNKIVERGLACGAVLLLWVINLVGVKWVIKLQFLLLIMLLLAGLDFAVGSFIHTDYRNGFEGWVSENFVLNVFPEYTDGYSWFSVFGVFFPAITGVMAGINMSGDLSMPSRDIPNGTFAAIATATGLYLMFVIFLGGTCTRSVLRSDFTIAAKVSAVRVLLLAGLYISSMSSCLGAMYGTPRVLQSIANENVIPIISSLGHGKGPNKVPVAAILVVAVIAIMFTMFGDINMLGPIVTMPFLLTYAFLDYAYFALAQTFDIQHQRDQRYRKSIPRNQSFGTFGHNLAEENGDLDNLFPERNTLRISNNTVVDDSPNVMVHSKINSWYSSLCNRWLSLTGAALSIITMLVVNQTYAILSICVVFVIWCYIGLVNPAVKPGAASEFSIIPFLRKNILKLFGKRSIDYEEIIVPSSYPTLELESSQMNEENDDFSSRQKFHQTAVVRPVIGQHSIPSDIVEMIT